jgi:multidrug transporter EmrE-like cation transporter
MNVLSFGLILTGVLLNACAQLLLKMGTNKIGQFAFSLDNILPISWKFLTCLPILGGLTCYAISLVVWIMGLSRVDVTIAYPLLSLGYVVNAIGAYYLLGESISIMRLSGIFVILIGVVLLARS